MSNIKRVNALLSRVSRLFTVGVLLAAIIPFNAFAATSNLAAGSASGLSISPLRQQLNLHPGQYSQLLVTLKNITGGPVEAIPTVRDFTSNGINGNPKILNTNQTSPSSIKPFLLNVNKVALNAGEQKTFSIAVHIPANASPGAYFGLIEYQAVPANNGSQPGQNSKVALTAAVSQLVFITIPGKITQLMQIKAINIYHDSKGTQPGLFFTSPPKSIGIDMANLANAFEQPYGTAQIQKLGGKVIADYQVNNGITRGLVLPYSTRIFINPIKSVSTPGPYTVIASITYGSNGSSILIAKKTFWYIPLWLILIILVIIAVLIVIVTRLYNRYKHGQTTKYRK